jgi:hypothetical protein
MKAKSQSNTDHQLREAVMTQLDWEAPGVDAGVSVSEGVVTLTGFVNTYSEKLEAEKAVKLVRGVRGVANDLVVRPFSQPTDTDIVKTALHTLFEKKTVAGARLLSRSFCCCSSTSMYFWSS